MHQVKRIDGLPWPAKARLLTERLNNGDQRTVEKLLALPELQSCPIPTSYGGYSDYSLKRLADLDDSIKILTSPFIPPNDSGTQSSHQQ